MAQQHQLPLGDLNEYQQVRFSDTIGYYTAERQLRYTPNAIRARSNYSNRNTPPEFNSRMRFLRLRAQRAFIVLLLIGIIVMATTASHGCTVSGS